MKVVRVWYITATPKDQSVEGALFNIGKEYKGDFGCIQTVLSHLCGT